MYEPSRRQRQLAVAAALSGAAAATLHASGGAAVEQVTGVLVGVAAASVLGVLYVHGQTRGDDQPAEGGDDVDEKTKQRRKEMEAEAGGFGGNAG